MNEYFFCKQLIVLSMHYYGSLKSRQIIFIASCIPGVRQSSDKKAN